MANKLGRRRRAEAGRVTAAAPPATTPPQPPEPASPHAQIEALIRRGGQITIGAVKPLPSVLIAHDGKKTLVMLSLPPDEPLAHAMARLEKAVATAVTTGKRVDDSNNPGADFTYAY